MAIQALFGIPGASSRGPGAPPRAELGPAGRAAMLERLLGGTGPAPAREGQEGVDPSTEGRTRDRVDAPLGRLPQQELERRLVELREAKARNKREGLELENERSFEEARVLGQLRATDLRVRSHEAAHVSAGGRFVRGGASFSYQQGPDGRQYAIGGEVGIDSSAIPGNPSATAEKMRVVRAAALAPGDPSSADLAIAVAAARLEAAALAELAAARSESAAKSYANEKAQGGSLSMGRSPAGEVGAPGPGIDLAA